MISFAALSNPFQIGNLKLNNRLSILGLSLFADYPLLRFLPSYSVYPFAGKTKTSDSALYGELI